MNTNTKNRGFTIIEVVLVLAIAGLIFMMVFIALPALQRSQRDTQRKNDLSRAQTAVVQYASNNRGSLPSTDQDDQAWESFRDQYLLTYESDTFIDPLGAPVGAGADITSYTFSFSDNDASPKTGDDNKFAPNQNVIFYAPGYTCTNGGAITRAGNRKVALRMYLEGGGVACYNN